MIRTSTVAYEFTYRYSMVPLELASACRKVHAALTGPKARQQNEIDEKSLHEVWDALEKLWKDFDNLRMLGTSGNVHEEDVDRYIHGWQVCRLCFTSGTSLLNPSFRRSSFSSAVSN
jgi:hypothetical protein